MANYTISFLEEKDHKEYTHFLNQCPDALYEHSLEVKNLIAHHFKFEPQYLIAKEGHTIVGALPLFKAKSLLEGTRLVSLPFFPFGGVIGKDTECQRHLLEEAKRLSSSVRFLEIRQRERLSPDVVQGFVEQSPITDFLLPLKGTEEEMFSSLDKRVRYDIKKAQHNKLTVALGTGKKELDDFYNVYLHTKKRRGVPAWPHALFQEALLTCPTLVGVTYLNNKPIASAFFFLHKKEIEYGFAGANYRYASLCPYYLLLWEVVKYGLAQGYTMLDFGGTTAEINDGNLYAFKARWCPEKKEIPYYFYASDSRHIPTLKKSFHLYLVYGKMWRLLPKTIIKAISPIIIRQFK